MVQFYGLLCIRWVVTESTYLFLSNTLVWSNGDIRIAATALKNASVRMPKILLLWPVTRIFGYPRN